MPTALETDRPAESTKTPGFWKRQTALPATRWQVVFDLFFGAVAPIVCLFLDPGIFHWGGLPGTSRLTHFQIFAYLEIGICVAALIFYVATRRASTILAGLLFTGTVFSLAVGIIILPLTLVGILGLIGVPGLTPFFTGYVFLRNARRCWAQSAPRRSVPSAILTAMAAAVLALMVPLGVQFETVRITNRALVMLQTGSEQEADQAIKTLKLARFAINADELAILYGNTEDKKQRERLARAYYEITGEKIHDRLEVLSD
jgi:hypothetical protein